MYGTLKDKKYPKAFCLNWFENACEHFLPNWVKHSKSTDFRTSPELADFLNAC